MLITKISNLKKNNKKIKKALLITSKLLFILKINTKYN